MAMELCVHDQLVALVNARNLEPAAVAAGVCAHAPISAQSACREHVLSLLLAPTPGDAAPAHAEAVCAWLCEHGQRPGSGLDPFLPVASRVLRVADVRAARARTHAREDGVLGRAKHITSVAAWRAALDAAEQVAGGDVVRGNSDGGLSGKRARVCSPVESEVCVPARVVCDALVDALGVSDEPASDAAARALREAPRVRVPRLGVFEHSLLGLLEGRAFPIVEFASASAWSGNAALGSAWGWAAHPVARLLQVAALQVGPGRRPSTGKERARPRGGDVPTPSPPPTTRAPIISSDDSADWTAAMAHASAYMQDASGDAAAMTPSAPESMLTLCGGDHAMAEQLLQRMTARLADETSSSDAPPRAQAKLASTPGRSALPNRQHHWTALDVFAHNVRVCLHSTNQFALSMGATLNTSASAAARPLLHTVPTAFDALSVPVAAALRSARTQALAATFSAVASAYRRQLSLTTPANTNDSAVPTVSIPAECAHRAWLVPLHVDVTFDSGKHRYQDIVLWDMYNTSLSPLQVAVAIADRWRFPGRMAEAIANAIAALLHARCVTMAPQAACAAANFVHAVRARLRARMTERCSEEGIAVHVAPAAHALHLRPHATCCVSATQLRASATGMLSSATSSHPSPEPVLLNSIAMPCGALFQAEAGSVTRAQAVPVRMTVADVLLAPPGALRAVTARTMGDGVAVKRSRTVPAALTRTDTQPTAESMVTAVPPANITWMPVQHPSECLLAYAAAPRLLVDAPTAQELPRSAAAQACVRGARVTARGFAFVQRFVVDATAFGHRYIDVVDVDIAAVARACAAPDHPLAARDHAVALTYPIDHPLAILYASFGWHPLLRLARDLAEQHNLSAPLQFALLTSLLEQLNTTLHSAALHDVEALRAASAAHSDLQTYAAALETMTGTSLGVHVLSAPRSSSKEFAADVLAVLQPSLQGDAFRIAVNPVQHVQAMVASGAAAAARALSAKPSAKAAAAAAAVAASAVPGMGGGTPQHTTQSTAPVVLASPSSPSASGQ